MYKKIRAETRAAGIANSTEQLSGRAKRNIEEFPVLVLDPSLDDPADEQTDEQTDKQRAGERERDGLPDEGPKNHGGGSTCPIQDVAVIPAGPLHPRNLT